MFHRAGYKFPDRKWPYKYATSLDISETDSQRMVYDFYKSRAFHELKPNPGAQSGMSFIMGLGYDIYIITGRQDIVREKTEKWIDHYFPYMVKEVIMTNSFTTNEISKADICRSLAINVMVDDSFHVCSECENNHIKGINFIGDPIYPWCIDTPLAARNWDEVSDIIAAFTN